MSSDFKRVKYVSDNIPELTGHWIEVPSNIPLYQCGSWIEQNYAEKQRAQTEASLVEPEGNVDSGINTPGAEEEGASQLDFLRSELEILHERLDDPDIQRHQEMAMSLTRTMQSGWELSKELKKIEADAEAAALKNSDLVASAEIYHREIEAEQKRLKDVTLANQKIMNQAFTSYSKEIKELRKTMAEAQLEIGTLKTELKNSRSQLSKANKIIAAWAKKEAEKNG